MNFLTGTRILEEIDSPINGHIAVLRDLTWGTYIQGGGLTQSGGILKTIWKTTLSKISRKDANIQNSLILGLGGGSLVGVIHKLFPKIDIIGVDVDPLMVDLGKKYLGLDEKIVDIVIEDAYDFVSHPNKFDLICVDLYNGDIFPKKFESDTFLDNVSKSLDKKGLVIFNRLYSGEKRPETMRFLTKLEKKFKKVEVVYPEANVMFLCYNI